MATMARTFASDALVQESGALDVEAMIADFLADPQRRSLELPHMTTGQRKHARKVVEAQADLRCESYGFGQDRRLHVFKQGSECGHDSNNQVAGSAAGAGARNENQNGTSSLTAAVSVKNTFIDDWLTPERTAQEAGTNILRSMPMQLSKGLLPVSPGHGSCTPVEKISGSSAWDQDCSPMCSTTASRIASSPSLVASFEDSPASSSREPMIEVRNTFIHFDSGSADERIVQSMPHSMFRQCLFEEQQAASGRASEEQPAAVALEPAACIAAALQCTTGPLLDEGGRQLNPGTEVMVQGLVKAPAFNGRCGLVQSWDEETARYSVLLSMPSAPSGYQQAKIKPENLLLTLPGGSSSGA
mmetsp:Transcript_97353/g.172368  ORF Transcript_97353/g.172368 Transcript_97353/m.172368 type:complete len:358 (+) Transcript_97353:46-1119(+)